MTLASISSGERGATDRLLAGVVARLAGDGIRVVGALRASGGNGAGGAGHCDSDLNLLPDGPVVRITQELGAGSAACRMDAGAFEEAVGIATARLSADGADLVVLNKFGISEAEGRGFRALIGAALGDGVPVLIGLSETHRAAFEDFAGGMAIALPCDEAAVLDWCRAMARPGAAAPQEV